MVSPSKKTVNSMSSVIATEHPLASRAGLEVMAESGNAFDAAVAAGFALSVVQPHLSGLGGDFFALMYHARSRKVYCLNSSGWSSSSNSVDAMTSRGYGSMPTFGRLSVVVPGFVKGMHEMHRRFGSIEFGELLKPAIGLAEDGFPVLRRLSEGIRKNLERFSSAAQRAMAPGGKGPSVGERMKQEVLGETIRRIAELGQEEFYRGRICEEVCAEFSDEPLGLRVEDFRTFEPEWTEPLSMEYGKSTVYEVPPNSMGATALLILKRLQSIDLRRVRPNSAERIRVTLEAVEEAYRRRDEELGDPRFATFDLTRFLSVKDSPKRTRANAPGGRKDADTTYFALSDREGNVLSCIQSLFHHFGSGVFVSRGGFFLNNRGSAFRYAGPNKLEPRKRPLHTLSSLLIEEGGEPRIAMGCSGGELRPQQHALLVTNMLDYSMGLEEAINFPRFLWRGGTDLIVESGYQGVSTQGYRWKRYGVSSRTGVAQGVRLVEPGKEGVCDTRGEGVPLGI